jgi:PTS system mannose-specific IIA component
MSERVPALLVMHADLAAAMLRAAEQVVGKIDDVEVLSNEGLSRHALEQEISRRVDGWSRGGLVLTDFWGGSCHVCGSAVVRGRGEIVIVTGVNLPILIDYLHNREHFAALELAERLQKKGQESFRLQRGAP